MWGHSETILLAGRLILLQGAPAIAEMHRIPNPSRSRVSVLFVVLVIFPGSTSANTPPLRPILAGTRLFLPGMAGIVVIRSRHTHCAQSGEVGFLVCGTWQCCELCPGLPVDWNIGVGVLPQIQESLVRLPRGGFIAHHLLRAAQLEPGQGTRDMCNRKAGIIDQLPELSRRGPAIAKFQVR